MKVFIHTLGTRGDVQPYFVLGCVLEAAGHHVTLCTSARFQPFVESPGLTFGQFNDEFMALVESAAGKDAMENASNPWRYLRGGESC
jgi:sterol 3beta-glucosyltransferase